MVKYKKAEQMNEKKKQLGPKEKAGKDYRREAAQPKETLILAFSSLEAIVYIALLGVSELDARLGNRSASQISKAVAHRRVNIRAAGLASRSSSPVALGRIFSRDPSEIPTRGIEFGVSGCAKVPEESRGGSAADRCNAIYNTRV